MTAPSSAAELRDALSGMAAAEKRPYASETPEFFQALEEFKAAATDALAELERLRDEIEDHAMQAVTDDDNRRKWRARAEAAEKECERLRAQVASHCLTCREQIAKREAAEKSLASHTAEADRLLNMMAAAHERDATALQQAEAERDEAVGLLREVTPVFLGDVGKRLRAFLSAVDQKGDAGSESEDAHDDGKPLEGQTQDCDEARRDKPDP